MDALSMLDSGAARITGTCLDNGGHYYVIEDLVHQKTGTRWSISWTSHISRPTQSTG